MFIDDTEERIDSFIVDGVYSRFPFSNGGNQPAEGEALEIVRNLGLFEAELIADLGNAHASLISQ